MDPLLIISKYYQPESLSFRILCTHSFAVAGKAVKIALQLGYSDSQVQFIREATMLHDIGIFYTSAPEIGCHGELPYISHGYKGYQLLVSEGLPKHALVCERHTGTGLGLKDIDRLGGLLPRRIMEPVSEEEKLIAYCDKFFSKDPARLEEEMSYSEVIRNIGRFGEEKIRIFEEWHHRFNP
jgi:uncharacterized protein